MSPGVTRRTTCRACYSGRLRHLFGLGDQFVSDFVPPGRERAGLRVPINLQLCEGCGLVQVEHTAPSDLLYRRRYWYRSGTTDTMRRELTDVVRFCLGRVDLEPGDLALDVGSNDGTLLRSYKEVAGSVGSTLSLVGCEPAENLWAEGRVGLTHLIRDFWSERAYRECVSEHDRALGRSDPVPLGDRRAKIVTACGMLYDLEDPNPFVADVARVLHRDGVFVAQLMCLRQTVDSRDVGNFAHEHLEFYSLESLRLLYERNGLDLVDVEENDVNGGSYRITARLARSHRPLPPGCTARVHEALRIAERGLNEPLTFLRLKAELEANRARCVEFLRLARSNGRRVGIYGASTKGNVIAQYYGLDRDLVEFAVDRDPRKVGLCLVGSGIPIVSEEEGRARMPDFLVVMPYAFLSEFARREADQEWRRRGGKFVVPLPEFKVV